MGAKMCQCMRETQQKPRALHSGRCLAHAFCHHACKRLEVKNIAWFRCGTPRLEPQSMSQVASRRRIGLCWNRSRFLEFLPNMLPQLRKHVLGTEPCPCMRPFSHVPSYRFPDAKTATPWPCILSSTSRNGSTMTDVAAKSPKPGLGPLTLKDGTVRVSEPFTQTSHSGCAMLRNAAQCCAMLHNAAHLPWPSLLP